MYETEIERIIFHTELYICYILKQRMGGLCAPTHCINSGFQSVALDG